MKKASKWTMNHHLPDSSEIKLPAIAHVPLVRCRVHLLGRAAPTDTPDGLLAMQKPLHELYENYSPVTSILTAYTSGLVLITPADAQPENTEDLWFPIQDLMECGAMRAIGGAQGLSFAPLTTIESRKTHLRPALFVFVFKRRDIPVSDCWAVECQSDDAALALMTACKLAHRNPAGWGSAVDRPPTYSSHRAEPAESQSNEEWDGAAAKEAAQWSSDFPRDYYEKPPLKGVYYTPNSGLIQRYSLDEMNMHEGFYYTPSSDLIRRYSLAELKLDSDAEEDDRSDMMSMHSNGEPAMNGRHMIPEMDSPSMIHPETASIVRAQPPYGSPMYFPQRMGTTSSHHGPVTIYPEEPDMYGFPPGMMGALIPETLVYPDEPRRQKHNSASGSESDHGKKKGHKKKKKSKKSSSHKTTSELQYNYYTPDGTRIVSEQAVMVQRAPPSSISEGPFESHLPQPAWENGYDPARQYGLKKYARDQQYVSGYTGPQHPYETHIDQFPPADYHIHEPYGDEGPYERRLPVPGARASKHDPQMLNKNFIIRQKDHSQRHL